MSIRPYTEAHAIACFELVLFHEKNISKPSLELLRAALADSVLVSDFPDVSDVRPDDDGDPEFVMALIRESTPIQKLVVSPGITQLLVYDYRGWRVSRDLAFGWFEVVTEALASIGVGTVSSGLRFLDVFIADTYEDCVNCDLWRLPSHYLPPAFVNFASPIWSSEASWFLQDQPMHNKLRVHGALVGEGTPRSPQFFIDHRQQSVSGNARPLNELFEELSVMHDANKALVRSLISDRYCEAIGLGEKE